MRQFYLLKDDLSESERAEKYLEKEYKFNSDIKESLLRIIAFLSNTTFP